MAQPGLRAFTRVFFGAYLMGITLSLPLRDVSRADGLLTHPSWVVGNLTFPFGNVTGEGSDGFPTYTGSNRAEACPAPLVFQCDKCRRGRCDKPVVQNKTDNRPCLDHYACHHMPWDDAGAVPASAADADRLAGSAPPVSMRSMTRREVMERALSWVASGYEYKWYHSTKSLEQRPTTQLEGCARNSSYACPVERYLADCSGYVGMAWRTYLPFPTPQYFLLPTVATTIACRDLQPGDAIVSADHVQLFRLWSNRAALQYVAWQMGGNWGKANQVNAAITTQKCSSRINLT